MALSCMSKKEGLILTNQLIDTINNEVTLFYYYFHKFNQYFYFILRLQLNENNSQLTSIQILKHNSIKKKLKC